MKLKDTCTDEEFDSDDLPLQVLHSPAGYYIGQLEPCGAPFSRLTDYYRKREDAERDLREGWTERGAPENAQVMAGLEAAGKLNKICKCCGKPVDPNHPTSAACAARHEAKDCLCFKEAGHAN
jgi:hypothetical protein